MEAFEEWRLLFEVGKRKGVDALIEQARERTAADVDIHRRGQQILVYALSETDAKEAEQVVADLLLAKGVAAPAVIARWNPGQERWQDPQLPVEPARRTLSPAWEAVGVLGWEVRLRCQTGREARRVAEKLLAAGRPTILGLRNRVTVGVPTEDEARQLAGELRNDAPTATITFRPLSRWRRWLIRQRLVGNYASGESGGGDWGGGGGGDGGGA